LSLPNVFHYWTMLLLRFHRHLDDEKQIKCPTIPSEEIVREDMGQKV
jgi:hypothetical protein